MKLSWRVTTLELHAPAPIPKCKRIVRNEYLSPLGTLSAYGAACKRLVKLALYYMIGTVSSGLGEVGALRHRR